MSAADQVPGALSVLPGWWAEAVLWLGAGVLIASGAAALGLWALARRIDRLRSELGGLAPLAEIQRLLERRLTERDDLDLRRIEHVLIDLRDGTRRLEDLYLRGEERRASSSEALVPVGPGNLAERVINRLSAMGYERIELVTRSEELEAAATSDGDVLVEARREGALCKGRVRVRAGRIVGVQLQPAFPIFP
jgi:hypothetical protein